MTLNFDPLTLNFCGTSGVVFKLCTNFEQNRTIRSRVVDHLARFRSPGLGGGALSPDGCQGCVDRTSRNIAEFVSELRYLAAFSNAGASKLSDVQNDAKFRTF